MMMCKNGGFQFDLRVQGRWTDNEIQQSKLSKYLYNMKYMKFRYVVEHYTGLQYESCNLETLFPIHSLEPSDATAEHSLNQHFLNSRNPSKMKVMVTQPKMQLIVEKRKWWHGGHGSGVEGCWSMRFMSMCSHVVTIFHFITTLL